MKNKKKHKRFVKWTFYWDDNLEFIDGANAFTASSKCDSIKLNVKYAVGLAIDFISVWKLDAKRQKLFQIKLVVVWDWRTVQNKPCIKGIRMHLNDAIVTISGIWFIKKEYLCRMYGIEMIRHMVRGSSELLPN